MQNKKDFLICANWKMNKGPQEALGYIRQLQKMVIGEDQKHFVFFVPTINLYALSKEIPSSYFGFGAQNCHFKDQGSFTGETSPMALKEIKTTHCLVGHSERRRLFFEDDTIIELKTKALLKYSIEPIICVGESLEQRKKGLSFAVMENQLGFLKNIETKNTFYIAYEPIWAIGGDKAAKTEQIIAMKNHIQNFFSAENKNIKFLYGGNVHTENAKELSSTSAVEGFLIGRASLDPNTLFDIYSKIMEK